MISYFFQRMLLTFMLLFFINSLLFAEQSTNPSPISISAHVGAFKNQEKYFTLKYDTDIFLAYGFELFLPLNKIYKRLGLLGKVTWMSATGVPLLISQDGPRRVEEGNEEVLKRVSNMGIKMNIPVSGNFSMDIMGGLSHGFLKQTTRNVPGFSDTESISSELNSFFGGIGIEYTIEQTPISFTSNVIYNYGLIEEFRNRGGTYLSFGIRYYLTIRK